MLTQKSVFSGLKLKLIMIGLVLSYFMAVSCSKETPPIFINGNWYAEFFEINGCVDSSLNISYDLSGDGCRFDTILNAELCSRLSYTFDTLGTYTYTVVNTNNTTQDSTVNVTSGDYELIDNNTLSLCRDIFLCDTVLIIKQGNIMDLIFPSDTLTGCGQHFILERK